MSLEVDGRVSSPYSHPYLVIQPKDQEETLLLLIWTFIMTLLYISYSL